jgi:BCD family chlorophyll transporter-like MFS transporter
MARTLGWFGIFRLGLVQTALGSIVVLTTSTINRVMVVELALPALLPGALVGWHYALQVLRPRWGFGSDVAGRRTPWIHFGMVVLAVGGAGAALSVALASFSIAAAIALAIVAFTLVGIGVGAAGTSLLALLATSVAAERRGPAATIVWLMMIAGFIVTTITAGHFLDPFSPMRLVGVTGTVSVLACLLTAIALWNLESGLGAAAAPSSPDEPEQPFRVALAQIWDDPEARRFTIFVFLSMLAYSMQDLILEPFAGIVFEMTPGGSTKLSGVQHGGVFTGMVLVALSASPLIGFGTLRGWTIGGCIASACALAGLSCAALVGPSWPLRPTVFLLGVSNGAFAVAAIGSMMMLAGRGQRSREGTRMGLWGAAQAVAFGIGGFTGAALVDVFRTILPSPGMPYMVVFTGEAIVFVLAALLAVRAIPAGRQLPRPVMEPTVA